MLKNFIPYEEKSIRGAQTNWELDGVRVLNTKNTTLHYLLISVMVEKDLVSIPFE